MAAQPTEVHRFKAHELPLTLVTVYNDRAEVKRSFKLQLAAGINEVLIQGVSQHINQESVRIDGRGNATIHDVQYQCKPALPEEVNTPKLQKLEDERNGLVEEKRAAEHLQTIMQNKIKALDKIVEQVGESAVNPKSKEGRFKLDGEFTKSLGKLFDFYNTNATTVHEKVRKLNSDIQEYGVRIDKLNATIDQTRNDNFFSRNISVLLESAAGGKAELDVTYQVWGASWHPSYDVRLTSENAEQKSTLKITYYGKIQQTTGEDWVDAPLILSTAQACLGGNVPELGTLNAVFYKPPPALPQEGSVTIGGITRRAFVARDSAANAMPMYKANAVASTESAISTVFTISRPTTIPSDSSEHKVTIMDMELHPMMIHETVPSKDTNVFLMAKLINESSYPFLAGQAAVYVDNNFITKSNLQSISPGERFACSLGVDPAVKVEYKPVHKYKEQIGLLTKSTSEVHEQKIIVKNTKRENVLITVKEHIPKSTDEKIKIKVLSPTPLANAISDADILKSGQLPTEGARMNKNNNLEWTLNMEPNNEKELLVKWVVEHPPAEEVVFNEAL